MVAPPWTTVSAATPPTSAWPTVSTLTVGMNGSGGGSRR